MTGDDEATSGYELTAEDHGRVRLLTLSRPEKLNAFTPDGYRALRRRLEEAAADDQVAACVLTGRGRAFSAGVDLSVMERPGGSTELGQAFDPMLEALVTFPKPLLAAVNGVAVGFGATILLHCDLVFVDEQATIRLPFVALGTTAEAASSWLLAQRLGPQRSAWVVLSGEKMSAAQAVACGFALEAAPAGRVVEVALERAGRIAEHAVAALVANKALLRHGWPETVAATWEREKEAMKDLAERVGPISWKGADRPSSPAAG